MEHCKNLVNKDWKKFLIAENKEAVMIATTWAEPESNGRMNIPKGWIKSRKKINIAERNTEDVNRDR